MTLMSTSFQLVTQSLFMQVFLATKLKPSPSFPVFFFFWWRAVGTLFSKNICSTVSGRKHFSRQGCQVWHRGGCSKQAWDLVLQVTLGV